MVICGLTGGIGHGKTTFAGLLADQSTTADNFETWQLIAEVATVLRSDNAGHPDPDDIAAINQWLLPLSDIIRLSIHCDISYDKLKLTAERLRDHPENYRKLFDYLQIVQATPSLATGDITDGNKQSFRPLLQWLGGYLVAAGGGVWYAEIVRRVGLLRSSGRELVTIGGVRYPSDAEQLRNAGAVILEIKRPTLPEQDSHDLTERQRNLIEADSVILNDASLTDLADCASIVYKDLQLRELQTQYAAADYQK